MNHKAIKVGFYVDVKEWKTLFVLNGSKREIVWGKAIWQGGEANEYPSIILNFEAF